LIEPWAAVADKETENRVARSGLHELLARFVWVCRNRGDLRAIDNLISSHTSLAATIGDLEFGDNEWHRAIGAYDKAIAAKTTDADLLGRRARAQEQLKNWDAAAADWLRAATGNPVGATLLVEFARRLTANGQVPLADATRAKARELFGEKKVKEAEKAPLAEDLANLLRKLDAALNERKQWDQIEPLIQACVAWHEKLGSDHPEILESMRRVGYAYWRMEQFEKAIALYEQLLKLDEARYGREHPITQTTIANLGVNYKDAGRLKEAIPLLEEAVRGVKKYPDLAWVMLPLLDAYTMAGENVRVDELILDVLPNARNAIRNGSPELAGLLAQISLGLLQQKKWADAEPLIRESLAIREKKQPDEWQTFNSQSQLGGALLGQKKYTEAEPLLLAGYEGMKKREQIIPPVGKRRILEALERLVQLYEATDRKNEAAKWQKELDAAKAQGPWPESKKP
jgi:tetratricopeptide (TPR) repeat protein